MRDFFKFCVLIPNYNSYNSLIVSLESIIEDEKIDVIIIDDGSVDKPDYEFFLKKFKNTLNLSFFYFIRNLGIVEALNAGLHIADQNGYKYVARLDAGDLNRAGRFAKQLNFLENNPSYSIVGSWVDFVSERGQSLFILRHPENNSEIQVAKYRFNPFVHPAVMLRLSTVLEVGRYPSAYPALEDYALFFKMLKISKGYNLPVVLLDYEVSSNSISTKKRFRQSLSKVRLLAKNYNFSLNATLGLVKSMLILFLPRGLLTYLKTKVYSK